MNGTKVTHKLAASLIIGQLLIFPVVGQEASYVPRGSAVMIDGKVSPGEWSDALKVVLSNGVDLLIKRHERFLLVAVVLPPGKYGFTDLLVDENLDLHASAKLGERVRTAGGAWSDWKWWNNDRWTANVARVEAFAGPTLSPEGVREYQIDLDRFPEKTIQLEVFSTIMNGNQRQAEWHSSRMIFNLP